MTDIQKVRILIGDTGSAVFTDDEMQAFLDMQSGSLFLAAALAVDAEAAKVSANLVEVRIGDYLNQSGRNQVAGLQAQAKAFRELEYNTPAFDFAEENYDEFTQYDIIRNYILRTAP
jgi:hypothetical protein